MCHTKFSIKHVKMNIWIEPKKKKMYLLLIMSSSSTTNGQANSVSSKSSGIDGLLELLEKEMPGELWVDILTPEYLSLSSLPRENCITERF